MSANQLLLFIFFVFTFLSCNNTEEETIYRKIEVQEIEIFGDVICSEMSFADSNNGYIASSFSPNHSTCLMAKTIDGGLNWEIIPVKIDGSRTTLIRSVFALDKNNVFISFIAGSDEKDRVIGIARSTDGANSWQVVSVHNYSKVYGLYFLNKDEGFAFFGNGILKTNDGGLNWSVKYHKDIMALCGNIKFIDENEGYAIQGDISDNNSSYSFLLKTTDRGESWNKIHNFNEYISSLSFTDRLNGYCFGYSNNLYKTSDGGEKWVKINSLDSGRRIYCSDIYNDRYYFATGRELYQSKEGFVESRIAFKTNYDFIGYTNIKRLSSSVLVVLTTNSIIKVIEF